MDEKKYVVITGASSGIGLSTAKKFAGRGKNLILIARRKAELEKLKNDIYTIDPTLDVVIKSVDLSIEENLYTLFNELEPFSIETWINNAGFGLYSSLFEQDFSKTIKMLKLNIEAVTLLSMLYVKKYKDVEHTQLINVSSAGGYTIVPNAITYCGTKFYVSSFTEGLAYELMETGAKLRAKVLAPAATKTEFGKIANDADEYDYDKSFGTYHTSDEIADFLLQLHDSESILGHVNREKFTFEMSGAKLNYAGNSKNNQRS